MKGTLLPAALTSSAGMTQAPALRLSMKVALLALMAIASATSAKAANRYAVVNAVGGLTAGSGVSGVTYLGVGRYEVTYTTNVSQCAYVATTANIYSQAVQAYTARGHLSANGVYVETKNQGGGLTDGAFHLIVDCGETGMKYAVVGYTANLVRASSGTTLAWLGTGQYKVNFNSAVGTCAYLATVGDPGNGLVFNPSGVYTASGHTSTSVLIETKNPGGGLQDGIPFHLAVICPTAPKSKVTVVDELGIIRRGSALTSAFRGSTGEYAVVTNLNLGQCATVATRGSVNTGVPFFPATVEIVRGPSFNTQGIEIRKLLFFGGTLQNEAFHTATLCK